MVTGTSSGGFGFFGFLALLFIALKLTGYLPWSWVWVLSPIWGPIILIGAALATYCVVVFIWAYTMD